MPLFRWPLSVVAHNLIEEARPVVVSHANEAKKAKGGENGGDRTAQVHRRLAAGERAYPSSLKKPRLAQAPKLEPQPFCVILHHESWRPVLGASREIEMKPEQQDHRACGEEPDWLKLGLDCHRGDLPQLGSPAQRPKAVQQKQPRAKGECNAHVFKRFPKIVGLGLFKPVKGFSQHFRPLGSTVSA